MDNYERCKQLGIPEDMYDRVFTAPEGVNAFMLIDPHGFYIKNRTGEQIFNRIRALSEVLAGNAVAPDEIEENIPRNFKERVEYIYGPDVWFNKKPPVARDASIFSYTIAGDGLWQSPLGMKMSPMAKIFVNDQVAYIYMYDRIAVAVPGLQNAGKWLLARLH